MREDLFLGISEDDRNRMLGCLSSFTKKYIKGDIIDNFNFDSELAGYVIHGRCDLQKTDRNGNVTVIETYEQNDIFSRHLSFSDLSEDSFVVTATQNCEILFFDDKKLLSPCGNCCRSHIVMMNNILSSVLHRSERMAIKIELLSKKNTRDKILGYFELLSQKQQSKEIKLPVTIAEMANYLCVNRSDMTREIKKLKDENIIDINRKTVKLKN